MACIEMERIGSGTRLFRSAEANCVDGRQYVFDMVSYSIETSSNSSETVGKKNFEKIVKISKIQARYLIDQKMLQPTTAATIKLSNTSYCIETGYV